MKNKNVSRSLRRRLERLEATWQTDERPPSLRIGILHELPADYQGERHIAIVRFGERDGDRQWCEFEERPGPAPGPPDPIPQLCLTETQMRIIGNPIDEG